MEEDLGQQQVRAERLYEGEEILHKARLIESDYKETLRELIKNESLSARCKMALLNLVEANFDKNVILANNQTLELRKLQFELALNKTKLSYTRPDVMNPAIVYIHQNIRTHFYDYVSRSLKMREREQQSERKTVQHVEYSDAQPQQQQPKRGFGLNPFSKKEGNE
jgi:hypothetical protein